MTIFSNIICFFVGVLVGFMFFALISADKED